MRQFFPDFFSVPRGEPSDDEMDKDEGIFLLSPTFKMMNFFICTN